MSEMTLVIGNKNYSSWSLRPWFLLKQAGIPFQEIKVRLHQTPAQDEIQKYSPSGKVPVLIDEAVKIWESLAICEYAAERFPEKKLWPADSKARAMARAISSEMHAGFQALRQNMPMNCRARVSQKEITTAVQGDIQRISEIWNECRAQYGKAGPMLFGHFSIADAMFAPVAIRFMIYGVMLDPISKAYQDAILSLPAMKEWLEAARSEKETIPEMDALVK